MGTDAEVRLGHQVRQGTYISLLEVSDERKREESAYKPAEVAEDNIAVLLIPQQD